MSIRKPYEKEEDPVALPWRDLVNEFAKDRKSPPGGRRTTTHR